VVPTSSDYRSAALERMGDADQLRRLGRHPFAMYAAGVAVECMLRAFRHQDRAHAAHHDVAAHFRACDRDRLGERAWTKLRGPVQTVHLVWLNNSQTTCSRATKMPPSAPMARPSTRSFEVLGEAASLNCAAIPQSLIASELFGHEKGAFTGAMQRRAGRFEQAQGGTLFLDEIGELPAETQVALLRVLQEREFERVGGHHPIAADVRVIAATNRDLPAAIAAGTFRSDLFYRLNVFPIELPPLRERKEDIPRLVEYFMTRAQGPGRRPRSVEPRGLELLQAYFWPGNIRELQNVVERALIVSSEEEELTIDARWFPGASTEPPRQPVSERPLVPETAMPVAHPTGTSDDASGPMEPSAEPARATLVAGGSLAELERQTIVRTLAAVGGNRRLAATKLGIGLRTLYEKLKRYDLR